MEIIVCIKQVPGSSKVEADPVTGVLKRDANDSKMNPYDLYALETALQIRELVGGHVKVISMGPPHAQEIIREAYCMGADDGALLTDRRFGGSDVLATAYALSQGIRRWGGFDLILCGKQTTDGDTAQVGPEIAEYLSIPHLTHVLRIREIRQDDAIVETDLPDAVETVRIHLPCLLSVEKDICQPRLPSYVRKMTAKDKAIRIFTLDDLEDKDESRYGLNGSATKVEKIFPPAADRCHEIWTGDPDELCAKITAKWKERKLI